MIGELLLLTAIGLFTWAFYKWATLNDSYFERHNVKYMKPSFLVGNTGKMFSNKIDPLEYGKWLCSEFPNES